MRSTTKNALTAAVLTLAVFQLTNTGCGYVPGSDGRIVSSRVVYTPEGQLLTFLPGAVTVYDRDATQQTRTVRLAASPKSEQKGSCLTASKDGKFCAGFNDRGVQVYAIDTGALVMDIDLPVFDPSTTVPLVGAALSTDGSLLAVAQESGGGENVGPGGTRRSVFRVSDGSLVTEIDDPADSPSWGMNLVFSPDGAVLYGSGSVAKGNTAFVAAWKTSDGTEVWRSAIPDPGHPRASRAVTSLALSADGASLASGGNMVNLWGAADGVRMEQFMAPLQAVDLRSLAFSPDGKNLVATTGWNVISDPLVFGMDGAVVQTFPIENGGCTDAAFSPDGLRIAGACPPSLKVWDSTSGALIQKQTSSVAAN